MKSEWAVPIMEKSSAFSLADLRQEAAWWQARSATYFRAQEYETDPSVRSWLQTGHSHSALCARTLLFFYIEATSFFKYGSK